MIKYYYRKNEMKEKVARAFTMHTTGPEVI